jgi:hypothetical protein
MSYAQTLYQRLRRRPSSVTIEVFAPENSSDSAILAQRFVQTIDESLREHVGPRAIRSSYRLPVTVVDPDRVPTN